MGKIIDLIKKHYIAVIIGTLAIVLFLVVLLLAITISHFFWNSDAVQIASKYMDVLFNIFSLIFGLAALVTAIVVREQVNEMKIQRMESYKPKLLLSDTHVPIIREAGRRYYKIEEPMPQYGNFTNYTPNSEMDLLDILKAITYHGELYIKLYNIGEGFARNVLYEWKSNYSKISEDLNYFFGVNFTKYENDVFSMNTGDTPINIQIMKQNPNRIVQIIPAKYLQPTERCHIENNVFNIIDNIIFKDISPEKQRFELKNYLKVSYSDKNGENNIEEFFEVKIRADYTLSMLPINSSRIAKELYIIPKQISEKEFLEK
ncbi:hypothetical protein HNP86_001097 [Methanococcus maripaludis]|uniref:Uncharacterized protein n=1 Tax=Methanococcus maripaludis TaxID=39152 RepID=A0A7J9NZ05_METMI|nr:hypothetical protein [Methanococcus maripaludis]MBA2850966.1 hypothetical protein [Methanococcus maripaludis]